MRLIKILLAVGLGAALLLGAGLLVLDRYVRSPAFKEAVLSAAHAALGSDIQIGELQVSLLSGVALRRVTVSNPPGFPGNLLTADALVVRYRLLPLLRRRLETERVSLEGPSLQLMRRGRGEWNYEKLGARPVNAPRSTPRPAEPPPPEAVGLGLDVALPKLAVSRGRILLLGDKGRPLARVEQLDLTGSLTWSPGGAGIGLDGRGQARIETLNVADTLFARRLAAPVSFTPKEVRLAPLTAKLADGDVQGDLTLTLDAAVRYGAHLEVKGADVERLLHEAGVRRRPISGKLQARASLQGTGGLPTLVGDGRAEILGGRLIDVPALNVLAVLLQVPALRDLRFDECRVDFTLAQGILQTPVIRVISPDVQLTGHGAVALATASLDHQMTLAVTKPTLARAPREVRGAFTERPDGFLAIDFRVSGSYDAPKTDLQDRVLKGVAEGFLQRGLRKLFK